MVKIKAVNFKSLKELFNEMDNEKGMLGLALIKELEFMIILAFTVIPIDFIRKIIIKKRV